MSDEASLYRLQRRATSRNQLEMIYRKLNDFIDSTNDKIVNRIQLVAQVYVEDYNKKVKQMTEQLKSIRKVLDQELLKQRANERLFFLEEERDFFRSQVMKLNEELTSLNRNNAQMKQMLEETKAQSENYKTLVAALQRKVFKMQNQVFQTEKLKQPQMSSSLPAFESKAFTSSPIRPTLTRFLPNQSTNLRTFHKSVEFKRHPSEHLLDSQLKRKEEILEQCIKDVKKKIFYRTLSTTDSKKNYFEEHKHIPFDKFTRTDKQDLVQSILGDPQLLDQFYTFMTTSKQSKKLDSPPSTRISKFGNINRVNLSDKIFKIKLCGSSTGK